MRKLLYVFSLLALFSCNHNEALFIESDTTESTERLFEKDGVIYPSTKINAMTRVSFNDNDVNWVNESKVTLPNGEEVDLPWVDGGSLPFFMQQKLSPDNGWELVAHTMAPDTQSNRSYLIFHNYVTGTLRVFCFMSTFETNNNGYWRVSFSEPTSLLNFVNEYALPKDKKGRSEVIVSNSTTQHGGGFALGWNGFQIELAYDSEASGIMKIEPMNVTTESIVMDGNFKSETEGTIIGKSSSTTTTSKAIQGVGKLAGNSAEKWLQSILPNVQQNSRAIGTATLLSLAKSGIISIFSGFSGLFKKDTQEILDVNLTTHGDISMKGAIATPTAAPMAPVNIHLEMIDGKLGGWNLLESPTMTWWTTVFNEIEQNNAVTNREYIYEVPQPQHISYSIVSNPKARISTSDLHYVFVRSSELPSYRKVGNVEYGKNVLPTIYPKYQYKGVTIIQQPRMRVHIRLTDFPNSNGLPFDIDLMDTNVQNKIVEFIERDSNMDLYIQFVCNANIVINGVENEYVSTRTVECTNHFWGSAY